MRIILVFSLCLIFFCCASTQLSHLSVDNFAKRIESQEQRLKTENTILKSFDFKPKKAIMYDVCITDYKQNVIEYPCSMGDSSVQNLIERLTLSDSIRHMNTSVSFIYYSAEIFTYQTPSQRYKLYTSFSPIYVYEDETKKAICASVDGTRCSYPVAKLKIERMYSRLNGREIFFDYPLINNLEEFSLNSLLKNVYEDKRITSLNPNDDKFATFKTCMNEQEKPVPCDMEASFVAEMDDSLKKIGREVESITYGLDSIMDCGADFYNLMVDNPVCSSTLNGACRYVIIQSIDSGTGTQSAQSFVYDKETKKFGKCDSGPEISISENHRWIYCKPDGSSLRDYRWR